MATYPEYTAAYCYEPLINCNEDDPVIRLLDLQPRRTDTKTITIQLRTYSIKTAPPYECLSYCWGSKGGEKSIECNGATLAVTTTLHTALSYLRNEGSGASRLLWIDQIAINQKDSIEKSAQVSIMHLIYEKAQRTIAWLGEPDNDSDKAFDFFRHQHNHMLNAKEFPTTISFKDMFTAGSERLQCFASPSREQAIGIVHLLKRPWFRRSWVIQEAAISKEVLVKCGIEEITFEALFTLCALSILVSSTLKIGRCYYIRDLFSLMSIRARVHAEKKQGQSDFLTLSNLLRLSQRCGAADPRDKLIALYGIASGNLRDKGLRADYTISAKNLFTKATFVMLQDDRSLRVLEVPHTDLATVPGLPHWVPDWSVTSYQERDLTNYLEDDDPDVDHALYYSRHEFSRIMESDNCESGQALVPAVIDELDQNDRNPVSSSLEDLVIDDAPTGNHKFKTSSVKPRRTKEFAATRASTPTNLQLSSDDLLGLSGHVIDKISDLSDVLMAPNLEPDTIDTYVEEAVSDFNRSKINPLLHDLYGGVRKFANYVKTLKNWETLALKNEPKIYPNGEPRSRAYWKTLCIGYFEGGQLGTTEAEAEKLYYRWRKAFSTVIIGRVIPLGSSLTTMIGTIVNGLVDGTSQQTFANLTEYTLQRRLAKTARGYLGLVPKGAMKGDVIALLRGGRVPFVLRPASGSWQLIGACYVHGAMFGELWDEDSCADIWLN